MKFRLLLVYVLTLGSLLPAQARTELTSRDIERVQREVRHELVMLAYQGVFDNLAYKVEASGGVTLIGQVTRPLLKSEAETAIRRIEGVDRVDNRIDVLPLSPFDDTLRLRLFRAIYGYGPLEKYALGANKPIRIIVNNGHVELTGVVDNEADRSIAGVRANGVSDVFSVKNNLQVAK
jgi:hyperosmotically inducible protein